MSRRKTSHPFSSMLTWLLSTATSKPYATEGSIHLTAVTILPSITSLGRQHFKSQVESKTNNDCILLSRRLHKPKVPTPGKRRQAAVFTHFTMTEGSAITKGSCVFILIMKWTGELLMLKTHRLVLNTHGITSDPQKFTRSGRIKYERFEFSIT